MPFSSGNSCIQVVVPEQSMLYVELLTENTPFKDIKEIDYSQCCAVPFRSSKYNEYVLDLSSLDGITVIDQSILSLDTITYLDKNDKTVDLTPREFVQLCKSSSDVYIADIARDIYGKIEDRLLLKSEQSECAILNLETHYQMSCLEDEYTEMHEDLKNNSEWITTSFLREWVEVIVLQSVLMQLSILKYAIKNKVFEEKLKIKSMKPSVILNMFTDKHMRKFVEEVTGNVIFVTDEECRAHTIDCLKRGDDMRSVISKLQKQSFYSNEDIDALLACTKLEQVKTILMFSAINQVAGIEFVKAASLNMHLSDAEIMRGRFGFDLEKTIERISVAYNFDSNLKALLTSFYSTHLLTQQTKFQSDGEKKLSKIELAGHALVVRAIAKIMVDSSVFSERSYKKLNREQADTILRKLGIDESIDRAIENLKSKPNRHEHLIFEDISSPLCVEILKQSDRYIANM